MSNIKTRESVKDIKVLDKAAVASERMKTALVRSKDQVENLMDDGQVSPSEYAEDKIRYAAEDVTDQVSHDISSGAKKAVNKGKEPELSKEWSRKNSPLLPTMVGPGSHRKVIWKGKCGHEWSAVIKNRVAGAGCPYCSHNKVLAGFNDL